MTIAEATSAATPEIRATPELAMRPTILYGIGDIANAIKTVIFGIFTLFFYTTVLGLSGTLVGLASALGVLWDALVDPYIGHWSDTLRSRLGRRHSFMLLGAITMGPTFWAFFSPPAHLTTGPLFVWLLVTTLLVRTATSFFAVPYHALGAELVQDYDQRTFLTGVRGVLSLVGTLGATVLAFRIFFPDTHPGVDPKLNYAGYPTMGLVLGCAMTIAGLIAIFGTFDRRQTIGSARPQMRERMRFWAGFAQSLQNRSFRALFLSFSLYYLGLVINGALSIHYLSYYAGITGSADLAAFQVSFYGLGLIGIVVWSCLSRRVDKHWLYIISALGLAALMVIAFGLIGAGRLFGTGNTAAYTVGRALAGFFGCVVWFIPAAMIADIADEDELVTGRRREGSYFGIFSFGQQFATGLGVLLTGIGLDRFARLAPGQGVQSTSTALRIGILFGPFPAVLLILAAGFALRYSLSRSRLHDVQHALAKQRAVERPL